MVQQERTTYSLINLPFIRRRGKAIHVNRIGDIGHSRKHRFPLERRHSLSFPFRSCTIAFQGFASRGKHAQIRGANDFCSISCLARVLRLLFSFYLHHPQCIRYGQTKEYESRTLSIRLLARAFAEGFRPTSSALAGLLLPLARPFRVWEVVRGPFKSSGRTALGTAGRSESSKAGWNEGSVYREREGGVVGLAFSSLSGWFCKKACTRVRDNPAKNEDAHLMMLNNAFAQT